jgi:hypothetical protein
LFFATATKETCGLHLHDRHGRRLIYVLHYLECF